MSWRTRRPADNPTWRRAHLPVATPCSPPPRRGQRAQGGDADSAAVGHLDPDVTSISSHSHVHDAPGPPSRCAARCWSRAPCLAPRHRHRDATRRTPRHKRPGNSHLLPNRRDRQAPHNRRLAHLATSLPAPPRPPRRYTGRQAWAYGARHGSRGAEGRPTRPRKRRDHPTRRPHVKPENAAGAARPWPSVKQPTVRADRSRAQIPSAVRPWTPRHSGRQR
jgi:hypothetical protein